MIIGMTYKMDSVMNCLIINKPEVEFRIPPPKRSKMGPGPLRRPNTRLTPTARSMMPSCRSPLQKKSPARTPELALTLRDISRDIDSAQDKK